MTQPLDGRIVLDCSTLLPGPLLGKLLVLEGARVIKIENPDRPDGARTMGAMYDDLNEQKELIKLNLLRPHDRAKFHDLVRKADGLIEGFRPSAKLKLGLDDESLHAVNPALCILSLVGYPESGPWRDRAGHDLNFAAVTGCLSLFREMPALPLADLFSAYSGALKLVAALDATSRGARGVRIAVSMSDVLREIQSGVIREFHASRQIPAPNETLFSGKFPCYRLYTAGCGRRVALGAIESKFWERACSILGVPELAGDGYAEGKHGKKVVAMIQAAFVSKSWADWAVEFANADCCVEPVLDYAEVYGDGV